MQVLARIARRMILLAATGSASLVGMGIGATLAQQAQPAPAAPAAAAAPAAPAAAVAPKIVSGSDAATDGWVKVCGADQASKKEVCHTLYDLRTSTGQILATVDFAEVTGETRKIIRLVLPNGVLLQKDIALKIDDQKPEAAKFNFCMPDGCVSQFVPSEGLIANLKKGKALAVTVYGPTEQAVNYPFPLTNFATANAGKALDEAALKKRAEALRQQVEQQQGSLEEQLKAAQKKAQQGQ